MSALKTALQAIAIDPKIHDSPRSPLGVEAGNLYRAGEWDRAHTVAQDLDNAEGSFWHGILHRAEGDWSNAAYWFRKVGTHPTYPLIHADAVSILESQPHLSWNIGTKWDPFRFVEWCREASSRPESFEARTIVQIQVSEWRHLFEWCVGQ